ncbi:MAG: J domain-containing protein [Candidatus Reddybacter sp.]
MSEITASPLTWPPQHPRTNEGDRIYGRFGKKDGHGYGMTNITIAEGVKRVIKQIAAYSRVGHPYRAHPDDVIISTNLLLRNDGLPRSNQKSPQDPGVAVYFTLDDEPRCIPCDSYLRIADNLAAIAATLEALRTVERHGSNMFDAVFTGFTPLPSPDQVSATTWRHILDYWDDDIDECKKLYRKASSRTHPDNGGDAQEFQQIQTAWQQAKDALEGKS